MVKYTEHKTYRFSHFLSAQLSGTKSIPCGAGVPTICLQDSLILQTEPVPVNTESLPALDTTVYFLFQILGGSGILPPLLRDPLSSLGPGCTRGPWPFRTSLLLT